MEISKVNNLYVNNFQGNNNVNIKRQTVDNDVVTVSNNLNNIMSEVRKMFEQTGNVLFKQIEQTVQGQNINMDLLNNLMQIAVKQNNKTAQVLIENIKNIA